MTTNGMGTRPLPDGWMWTTIENIITDIRNGISGNQNRDGNGYPVSRIETISDGTINLAKVGYLTGVEEERIQQYRLYEGDILFSNINSDSHLGKTALISQGYELYHGMNLLLLRSNREFVLPRYLHYLCNQYRFDGFFISIAQHAVNQSSINQTKLKNVLVPLAPLAEQERIVAEIEKQFTRLDQAVVSLRRLQTNLSRYKASVLKAACEGRLVPQDPTDEPASELLQRILTERRSQWQATHPGKKYEEPTTVDTSTLPNLPKGWTWARVDQTGSVQLGRQRAPKHHNGPYMRPYLRVANVFEDRIDKSNILEMNFTPQEYETYRLEFGDILLNEGQSLELIGRPAMYRDEVPGACFQNTLVRYKAFPDVLNKFALIVFRTYMHTGRFQKIAKWTTNIAHLGANRFAELEFPLPPLAEQHRIVAEVERRLSVITTLEQTLTTNLARAERLRQSILHRAFTGQLV